MDHNKFIGKKFGKLTVVEWHHRDLKNRVDFWNCLCECGNVEFKVTNTSRLKNGQCTSCGCANIEDLTNRRFGNYICQKLVGKDSKHSAQWLCLCDCGKVFVRSARNIKKADSCGCLRDGRDFVGEQFGFFLVQKEVEHDRHGKRQWLCQCQKCFGKPTIRNLKELKDSVGACADKRK